MAFIFVRLSELEKFAIEHSSEGKAVVPITPWRASSQVLNPFANSDDVLLIVAKDQDDKIIGYIGVLPSILRGKEKKPVYYSSCWWADPNADALVSLQLLSKFLQYTGGNVLFSDLSDKTAAIIQRIGEYKLKQRKGFLLRFRSGLHERSGLLKPDGIKNRLLITLHNLWILKIVDSALNIFHNFRIKKYIIIRNKGNGSLTFNGLQMTDNQFPKSQPVNSRLMDNQSTNNRTKRYRIDYESPSAIILDFIRSHTPESATSLVSSEIVDWWQRSSWLVKKTKENSRIGNNYNFSSFADDFHYKWISFFDDAVRKGLACLSFRDGTVKTLYLWYEDKYSQDFFEALILKILEEKKNHTLISFHEEFVEFLVKEDIPVISIVEKKRHTAIPAKFSELNFVMQDGDGDYVFT